MQLSPHFTLEEATFSSTALRLGIDNTPNEAQLANMRAAAEGMEKVRWFLGAPIHIDSWLRVPALNAAVGGAKQSAHLDGFAVDFICPQYGTPAEIAYAIVHSSGIPFDKCIQEGRWVHISFAPEMRGIALTAHFDETGKATYTEGVA